MTHLKGRPAKRYPLDAARLRGVVTYNPDTGGMVSNAGYGASPIPLKDGYLHLRLPVDDGHEYFRVDHLAWMYMMGVWPDGWIEHVNGLLADNAMDNLVYCDRQGRRWWYGPQIVGGAREYTLVEGEGLDRHGPVTTEVTVGGRTLIRPSFIERAAYERNMLLKDHGD